MLSTFLLAACLGATPLAPADVAAQLGDANAQVQLDRHGSLRFARGELGYLGQSPELVQQFVRERAAAFTLRDDEQLRIATDGVDLAGQRHLRLRRSLKGIPVEFDELRLHAAPTGLVYAIEGELTPLDGFAYRAPALSPWQAQKVALGGFNGKLLEPSHAELVILGEGLDGIRGTHLAYRVHVAFPARPGKVPVIEDQYIDAQTGEVLAHLSRVYTEGSPAQMQVGSLNGTVTVNVDDFGGQGVLLKDISLSGGPAIYTVNAEADGAIYSSSNTSTDFQDRISGEPGSVAYNVSQARAFFQSEFGWNRWDFGQQPAGQGGLLAGFAHEGQNLANAYFVALTSNGQVFGTMHYGDGDNNYLTNTAKCLDVTGHEMGHGVVQGTAGLVYHNQSGALNEHFADVFGWIFKNREGQANDYIGDQCVGPALQPALRDMCNPGGVPSPQPGTMSAYVTSPDTDDGDHGGVHTNSGIPNHAACLARNGMNSLGKVGAIWFKALHDHLGSTSSFLDMVNATMTSCSELMNGGVTTQSDCDAVASAWTQVGLAAQSSGGGCPANASLSGSSCVCNAGYQLDSSGACTAVASQQCPSHAHLDASSGNCYCDTGYDVSSDGTQCVPVATGGCGDHSHLEGGACVCDTCYTYGGSPGQETAACVPDPNCNASCNDPASTNDATCSCIPGVQKDANNKCTQPVGGTCGNETFAGRCAGNVLIYCYTTQAGNSTDQVEVFDCSQDTHGNTACGPDTVNGGYNCVPPAACAGNVPPTGVCQGTSASYCSDGTVQSVDCSGSACIQFKYDGYDYNFCNPCPSGQVPIASGAPASNGDVQCVPDTSTGSGAVGGSTGSSGSGGDSKSGCSASSNNGPSIFVMLMVVAAMAFRRKR